jgi:hypothetical protein
MSKVDTSTLGVGLFLRRALGPPAQYGVDPWVGIWKKYDSRYGGANVRTKFYTPTQTWTQKKQDNWDKFGAGVLAWQVLTQEEKEEWNFKARGLEMYGFNLFLREYMYG